MSGAAPATDVSALIGQYPFRHLPHPDPDVLVRVLDREGLGAAWVGHLPTAFHRDPGPGNRALYHDLRRHRERLRPAPAVRPDWPAWERELSRATSEGAAAIRAYPAHWGLGAGHTALNDLAAACAEHDLPLVLTVRFEDARQRHPMDIVGELGGASIRGIVRAGTGVRLVVIGGGRALVEEVHWGLTPVEQSLTWYDTSWLWGPPEDDFAHLMRTVGPDRFLYGTGWPFRLAQVTRANLALLPDEMRPLLLADPSAW